MKKIVRARHLFRIIPSILLISASILMLYGCGKQPQSTPPTSTPITIQVTATPEPTNTPEPPTATPTVTSTPDKTATIAAKATAEMEAKMKEIAPQLEKLGFSLDSGELLYSDPSTVSLSVDSYMEDKTKVVIDEPLTDFIMRANITWSSTSGLAGCGIVFRAEEDLKRGANYQFYMLRLSGAPAWTIDYFRYGQYQYSLVPSAQFTSAIDERQDATNTITLIAQGDKFETMINTTSGMDTSDKKLAEGRIALLSWQESGKTTCTFSNVWVWGLTDGD